MTKTQYIVFSLVVVKSAFDNSDITDESEAWVQIKKGWVNNGGKQEEKEKKKKKLPYSVGVYA